MAFNVLKYSDVEAQKLDTYQVDGVPTDLFGKSFVKVKSITMNKFITDVVNAKIRYIIIKNLVTYYTFSANNWKEITNVITESVLDEGLSSVGLANISEYARYRHRFYFFWQSTAIDALVSKVDLRCSWSVASLATDYTIKYTSNNTLQVSLLSDGDFKINYQNAV